MVKDKDYQCTNCDGELVNLEVCGCVCSIKSMLRQTYYCHDCEQWFKIIQWTERNSKRIRISKLDNMRPLTSADFIDGKVPWD